MASSGRQALPIALALLFALALYATSGCVQEASPRVGENSPITATPPPGTEGWPRYDVVIPEGAWDPGYSGAWYELAQQEMQAPGLIHWINDDDVLHRMIVALRTPAAGLSAQHADGGDDGHAHGHDHSGLPQASQAGASGASADVASPALPDTRLAGLAGPGHEHAEASDTGEHAHAGTQTIDVTVAAGEDAFSILHESGVYDVHCHPHPWMIDTWDIQASDPTDWTVRMDEEHYVGEATVALARPSNQEVELGWLVQAPNLKRLELTAIWDDARDDVVEVEGTNEPDTVQVEILNPSGVVVANGTQKARFGNMTLAFSPEEQPWPTSIVAGSAAEADARLASQRPDSHAAHGVWVVRVLLLDAPGLVVGGQPLDVGDLADGQQSVVVEFVAVHEKPYVLYGPPGPVQVRVASWTTESRSDES